MQRPPHLAAIVPIYATDDRYTDDCHYTPGGSMRMYFDVGTYGGLMVAMNALPPPPEFGGGGWAELWRTRLERNEPYLLEWLRHPVDGPYWRGASLRPDYDRITCPVLLIGGWHDGYSNPMLRMFTQLKTPTRIIVGPWSHMRPNVSLPGPRIDYIAEMVRFFARHLRADATVPEGPRLAVYMQEFHHAVPHARPDPGLLAVGDDGSAGGLRRPRAFPGAGLVSRAGDGGCRSHEYDFARPLASGMVTGPQVEWRITSRQINVKTKRTRCLHDQAVRARNPRVWLAPGILYGSSSAHVATFCRETRRRSSGRNLGPDH